MLTNALDYAFREFNREPAPHVRHGGVGAGRAVEQPRRIHVELQRAPMRSGVHIGGGDVPGLRQGRRSFIEMPLLARSAEAVLTSPPGGSRR